MRLATLLASESGQVSGRLEPVPAVESVQALGPESAPELASLLGPAVGAVRARVTAVPAVCWAGVHRAERNCVCNTTLASAARRT